MGRIIASVHVENATAPSKSLRCDALVDTGASHLVLPSAWRERLGDLQGTRVVQLENASQDTVEGEICGPVKIQIEGFPAIFSEVLFQEIAPGWRRPDDGQYDPLIGYLVLEQSQAAVDMLGHRLVHVRHLDLK